MGGKGSGRPRKDADVNIPEMPVATPHKEWRWVAVGMPRWGRPPKDEDGFPWYVDQGMITNPIGGQGGRTLNEWFADLQDGGWQFGPTWTFANHTIQWVYREVAE